MRYDIKSCRLLPSDLYGASEYAEIWLLHFTYRG